MKAMKYLSMVLLMLVTSVCMFSCSDEYTLERFTVVFVNDRMEILTQRDYGTFNPGDRVSAEIPTGAAEYYMGTYLSGRWFVSPNYNITITTNNLSQDVIGQWTAN